ncbi:MAG TPA: response regulator [Stellaceae bacterium]|nr:response regulator [Stellaceae bacterium]
MVVEDDASLRRIVVRMLEGAGFAVTAAHGFGDAMEAIESTNEISLLLADIEMPAGTPHGYSIGASARRHRHDLKIVYMTAGPEPEGFALFDRGGGGVLRMPFTAYALIRTITVELARH